MNTNLLSNIDSISQTRRKFIAHVVNLIRKNLLVSYSSFSSNTITSNSSYELNM